MRDTAGVTTPLSPDDRRTLLAEHPAWEITGDTLQRTFRFADFAAAIGFVNRVALVAERSDHHPDIDIRWNRVTLALTTHSAGTLTDRDRDLVERIDGWGVEG